MAGIVVSIFSNYIILSLSRSHSLSMSICNVQLPVIRSSPNKGQGISFWLPDVCDYVYHGSLMVTQKTKEFSPE